MRIKSFLSVFLFSRQLVKAVSWNFNVVSLFDNSYTVAVKINNQIVQLSANIFPLFQGSIEDSPDNKYKYVILDESNNIFHEEEFVRVFDTSKDSTLNEVYNRSKVIHEIAEVENVYEPIFSSGTEKYQKYPGNEIYTFYATCEEVSYTDLKFNPLLVDGTKNENTSQCSLVIITSDEVINIDSASLSLIGYHSRQYKKLSWKFSTEKAKLGRKSFKLRSLANDPSLIRDKMTNTLMSSVGMAVQSQNYARLIINDQIWGLYSLVDNNGSKWIASFIHGDKDFNTGFSYKMFSSIPDGPFASLRYMGEEEDAYKFSGSYGVDEVGENDLEAAHNFTRLAQFTKKLEIWINTNRDVKTHNEDSIISLNSFFYIDSLLRQLVIESLVFAYDNFWAQLGNYNLYHNPEENKYLVIPYDFDGTFNGGMGSSYYSEDSLSDCIGWANDTPADKYLVDSLFSHEIVVNRFGEIMRDVIEKVFNVETLSPFIDSLEKMLEEEVVWNFESIDSLDPQIPGNVNHWTFDNFIENINYKLVLYNPEINTDDAHHAIKEWIELRGGYCKNYVKSLDLSKSYSSIFSSSSTHTNGGLNGEFYKIITIFLINIFLLKYIIN